jgi:hypothetical protein
MVLEESMKGLPLTVFMFLSVTVSGGVYGRSVEADASRLKWPKTVGPE